MTLEFTFACGAGSTFHHEGSCSAFYECLIENRPVLVYCPGNEEYNHHEGKCSPPEEANCVLPVKNAWGWEKDSQEGNEDKSDGHAWFKEESVEPKNDASSDKSNEEEPSDDDWFSFFRVLEKETMREESGEEHSSSKEDRKDEEEHDHVSDSEESQEEHHHSFWKRQTPLLRFRRSYMEPLKEEINLAEMKVDHVGVVDLEDPNGEHHDAIEKQEMIMRSSRSAKTNESEEKEKNDKENRSEEKPDIENVEESKEAEHIDTMEKQVEVYVEKGGEESFDTEDYPPIEKVDEGVQIDGDCGSLIISDPLSFQLSAPEEFKNMHFNIHTSLGEEFPFVIETLLAGAIALPEEKGEGEEDKAEDKEKSNETRESPVKEEVVEEERKDVLEESLLEKVEEVEKKEEEKPEDKKTEEIKPEEEKSGEKKLDEKKTEEEKANEEIENKPK